MIGFSQPSYKLYLTYNNNYISGLTDCHQMNRIKDVLKLQGRTQKWLSKQLNINYISVTQYCNNIKQPKLEVLYKIAKILDVDVKDLLVSTKGK